MWCDCAPFLLITCSQNAMWAACRNKSLNTGACVVKTVLPPCEPEAYSLDWKCPPLYVYVCVG